ncbi:MAG: HD-GYP domain-containing protein [Desulfovibrio sp.]|uniref:HD-GYP domain-containing protein n=1 Tax=Desulfovibrio sp. 7SRBS1 TaxID=3378064 RepID=UPI003B3EC7A3
MKGAGNLEHIAELSLSLGRAYGLRGRDLEDLRLCATFHDVGKVTVPGSILLKPGPLTEGEWVLMRRHTWHGAHILQAGQVSAQASLVALTHHEKWDGSGYPFGLHSGFIPLFSRIVSIADVYDALVSKRSYKPAFSRRESLCILCSQRKKSFDPLLLDLFVALLSTLPAESTMH